MSGVAVAIDGPAGAGKSTVSKALALKTGFQLLDTGAMYRAITVAWLEDRQQDAQVTPAATLAKHDFSISIEDSKTHAAVDGVDITAKLRDKLTTANVSIVAASAEVREWAVSIQRELVAQAVHNNQGIILEGRDIGTTVLPNAQYKFFLTASNEMRAQRRAQEVSADASQILKEIQQRDEIDSNREVSPLRQADDAVLIDASHLSVDEVVQAMLDVMK